MVYYNVKETAAQWKISPQMVRRFCLDGRVTGAVLTDKGYLNRLYAFSGNDDGQLAGCR